MKISVAVLFGGKSVEHEVSIISAVQAMKSLDTEKYTIIPVYITKTNEFYSGEDLMNIESYKDIPGLLKKSRRVSFRVEGSRTFLESKSTNVVGQLLGVKTAQLVDVAFPVVHGTNVEDGALQGFLETVNLPYVGPHVLASAVGMDKYVMKVLLAEAGFPVLPGKRFSVQQWHADEVVAHVEKDFSYPVIVKPINLGSSVGIGKASSTSELRDCLDEAFSFAKYVLVEPAVENLKEINCSVVGDSSNAEASECEEPHMSDEILSYEDKYVSTGKGSKSGSKGMASLKRKIPADITKKQRDQIRSLAVDSFKHLDLAGVTRVDFLMDGKSGEIWINEVNTIPGSLSFYLWEPIGVSYPELLDRLIFLALKRERETQDLSYSFDTNILAGTWTGTKGTKS
ncbi:MAG: D-alanine--D-alanine ligase [Propionibacteriaceae bacterium]|jgi:D-alanine-D-alanine ligase|nr:D-alanine--D-alanine ligase [Propionibacteriaceae bacterium]